MTVEVPLTAAGKVSFQQSFHLQDPYVSKMILPM